MTSPKLFIVVVGYNSRKDLKDCFDSIEKSSYKNKKVVFVDNNSTDNSVDYVKENYPDILVIANRENTGFAKANNSGIQKALQEGADYVFILNPDTILDEKCLEVLMAKASSDSILQPLILIYDNQKTNLINTTGSHVNYLGFSYCNDYKKDASTVANKTVPSASRAGMLISQKILEKVGLFDETFFMYSEDLDLSWRARSAGFEINLLVEARLWHKYNFSKNTSKMYLSERNRLLFLLKNFQLKTLLLEAPIFIINELSVLALSIVQGWLPGKLKSYGSVILLLGPIAKKRAAVNHLTQRNDAQLKKFLSPDLDFSEVKLPFLNIYEAIISYYWKLIYPFI